MTEEHDCALRVEDDFGVDAHCPDGGVHDQARRIAQVQSLLIPARLIFAPAFLVLTLSCGKYAEWVQRGKLTLTRDATRRNFLNRSQVRTAT